MGCAQGGCFGPRRRDRQVYAQLLEQIHHEARNGNFSSSNLNIYESIQNRLIKAAHLRKLIDNLLTHRTKLTQAMTLNLQLTSQAQQIESKYAGLVVADEIAAKLFRDKGEDEGDHKNSVLRTASTNNGAPVPLIKNDQALSTIDPPFDLIYFLLLNHLLETEGRMYSSLLGSIYTFCRRRREKLTCRGEVWKIMEVIMGKLKRNSQPQKSANAYLSLLQRVKEGGKEEESHEGDLLVVLRLWLKEEQSEIPIEATDQNLQLTLQRIIRVWVERLISGWDSKVLYRSMFALYDDEKMPLSQLLKAQALLMGVITEQVLHANIFRGLFLYQLTYLSTCHSLQGYRSSVADEFQSSRYPRIFDRNSKLRGYEALERWGEKGYINLEESVNYSGPSLVAAFTSNLTGQKEFSQQVIKHFFKLSELLSPKANYILVGLLLEQIKWSQTEDTLRRVLIELVRQVLEARRLLQMGIPQDVALFIPLDLTFNNEAKLQLLHLYSFVSRRLSLAHLLPEDFQTNPVPAICQTFHSIYQAIQVSVPAATNRSNLKSAPSVSQSAVSSSRSVVRKSEDEQLIHLLNFSNAVVGMLKALVEKHAFSYVLAFTAILNRFLLIQDSKPPVPSLYFLLYILYSSLRLLDSHSRLPQKMPAINKKITPSIRSTEVRHEIAVFISQYLGPNGDSCPNLAGDVRNKMEQLSSSLMVKESEVRELVTLSMRHAKGEWRGSAAMEASTSRIQFGRESVREYYSSRGSGSVEASEDRDFRDIMGRIDE